MCVLYVYACICVCMRIYACVCVRACVRACGGGGWVGGWVGSLAFFEKSLAALLMPVV